MQPPWRLTIISRLFWRVLAAYNSRIVNSNTTSGVTTFEVGDPRFVLEKKESSAVSILFLADALANTEKARLLLCTVLSAILLKRGAGPGMTLAAYIPRMTDHVDLVAVTWGRCRCLIRLLLYSPPDL